MNEVILKNLYPLIETNYKKNNVKIKNNIRKCFEARAEHMYDIGPFHRIPFGQNDNNNFFSAIDISEKTVLEKMSNVYYMDIKKFNPSYAKDAFTISVLNIIRYLLIKEKNRKEAELYSIYLSFSGKFYPSIHYGSYPVAQPDEHRHVMEYVINSLSNKFDIKKEGSLYNTIKSTCITWLNTYEDKFKSFEDEDVVYLVQQLHDRIKSFMVNIAKIYYPTYDKKNIYMSYDADNLSDDNFHIADNDSFLIERCVEKSMEYLTTNNIDYSLCKMASDSNVKVTELKTIMEAILNDRNNLILVKEFIRIIIVEYFNNSKSKDIRDYKFISSSIVTKPNSKNPNVIRQREILEMWLNERSDAYRRRKSREATRSSYHKSVTTYIVLLINQANK